MTAVLVTGGGTVAPLDAVRHVGNRSSGTTAARIAEEFLRRGATVHHAHAGRAARPLRAALAVDPDSPLDAELARVRAAWAAFHELSPRLREHPFETFDEYHDTVRRVLTTEPIEVVVLAAAVSDYGAAARPGKLSSDAAELVVRLERLPKVISRVKGWRPGVFQVGFKLLADVPTEELVEAAYRHGRANGSDLTVGNAVVGGDFRDRTTVLVTPARQVTPVTVADLPARLADAVLAAL